MSLDYSVRYPGQIDTSDSANYPQGKAQNITVVGDGTGTPWEQDLVNDLFGFLQAMLLVGGITPTGVPDTAANSQYFDALQAIFVDAKNGGSYAPSTLISIDGVGLHVGTLDADTAVFDLAVVNGPFGATGLTELFAGLEVTGATVMEELDATDVTADSLTVSGLVSATTVSAGAGTFFGTLSAKSNLIVDGTTEIKSTLTPTGTGRVLKRIVAGPDANATYGVNDADIVHIATTTAVRDYTLSTVGAVQGDEIEFTTSGTNDVKINGVTVISPVIGQSRGIKYMFHAGAWIKKTHNLADA